MNLYIFEAFLSPLSKSGSASIHAHPDPGGISLCGSGSETLSATLALLKWGRNITSTVQQNRKLGRTRFSSPVRVFCCFIFLSSPRWPCSDLLENKQTRDWWGPESAHHPFCNPFHGNKQLSVFLVRLDSFLVYDPFRIFFKKIPRRQQSWICIW